MLCQNQSCVLRLFWASSFLACLHIQRSSQLFFFLSFFLPSSLRNCHCYTIQMQREQQAQQNHDAIMEATGVSSSSTRLRWRTPALYIFAGVAGMLGFIGVASVALVCLWWKMSSASTNAAAAAPRGYNNNRVTGSAAAAEESSEKNEDTVVCCVGDAGPHKVLIIMPGQQQPTFIGSQLSHLTAAPSQ